MSDSTQADRPDPRARRAGRDELIRTLTPDGGVSIRVLVATELVREAAVRHGLASTATNILGRVLMGAVLLAAGPTQGQDETVQLHFRGEGPLGTLTAISDPNGRVRGRVTNPLAQPPLEEGRPNIAAAIGRGVLTVVRQRPSWKEPHSGMVPLVTGEVAKDITHYLANSEQVPSAVGLGVKFLDGTVEAAGGFIVQALPGASDEVLAAVEANVRAIPGAAELVHPGYGAEALLEPLVLGVGSGAESREAPVFHCPCSRERALRAAGMLGRETIREIAAADESQEVLCEFCAERYEFEADELSALFPDS